MVRRDHSLAVRMWSVHWLSRMALRQIRNDHRVSGKHFSECLPQKPRFDDKLLGDLVSKKFCSIKFIQQFVDN